MILPNGRFDCWSSPQFYLWWLCFFRCFVSNKPSEWWYQIPRSWWTGYQDVFGWFVQWYVQKGGWEEGKGPSRTDLWIHFLGFVWEFNWNHRGPSGHGGRSHKN